MYRKLNFSKNSPLYLAEQANSQILTQKTLSEQATNKVRNKQKTIRIDSRPSYARLDSVGLSPITNSGRRRGLSAGLRQLSPTLYIRPIQTS